MSTILGYDKVLEKTFDQPPLLMLDRVELAADGRSGRAAKAVSNGEAFFQGHFPGQPIMPGVLQIAAMSQLSSLLLMQGETRPDAVPWLAKMQRIKFRKPIFPGDLMVVESEIIGEDENGKMQFKTTTRVGDNVACSGILVMASAKRDELIGQLKPLVSATRTFDIPEDARVADASMIPAMIPHRFPFMFVDRVICPTHDHYIGIKNITGNEWFFRHAPIAVLPLCLQMEIAAQIACAAVLSLPGNENKLGYFMSIDEGEYLYPVTPGDQLVFEINSKLKGRFGVAVANGYVGDRLVSRGQVKFAIVDREDA
jgi:3-hydroxymyristoyl/3-hydroxydecanoyl-(acyl carrier protein) dehydratase